MGRTEPNAFIKGRIYKSKSSETRVECLGESDMTPWHFKAKLLTTFGTLKPGHSDDSWVKASFELEET